MYYMKTYDQAINYLAEIAPDVNQSHTRVIEWAESLCECLQFIYGIDYDRTTTDLYAAIKEAQGIEDE